MQPSAAVCYLARYSVLDVRADQRSEGAYATLTCGSLFAVASASGSHQPHAPSSSCGNSTKAEWATAADCEMCYGVQLRSSDQSEQRITCGVGRVVNFCRGSQLNRDYKLTLHCFAGLWKAHYPCMADFDCYAYAHTCGIGATMGFSLHSNLSTSGAQWWVKHLMMVGETTCPVLTLLLPVFCGA